MSTDSSPPLIFKEDIQKGKPGLIPLPSPSNYINQPSEDVQFICFPYKINENVIPEKARPYKVQLIRQKHPNASIDEIQELLFLDLPEVLVKKYRMYLRKNFPSIADKPLILVMTTDYTDPYPLPNDIFCIRTSLYKSNQRKQDLVFPSPVPWAEYKGPLSPDKISVGFCGIAGNHIARAALLEFLYNSPRTNQDFVFRKRFWGHLQLEATPEQKQMLQAEFNDIVHRNIFSVCSRGGGNYSVRFYETLREGRIPVLLDSDMPLPFENEIDWKNIIICEKTPEEVEAKMLDWAENRDLVAIQNQCRKIWEEYLYLPKFLEKLPQQLQNLM